MHTAQVVLRNAPAIASELAQLTGVRADLILAFGGSHLLQL